MKQELWRTGVQELGVEIKWKKRMFERGAGEAGGGIAAK
jgi:hypothetical protein